MILKLAELTEKFENLWPKDHAEDWDRVGLVSGDVGTSISRVLVTVDVTHDVIDEAEKLGCELILAHHPLLLKSVTSVAEATLKGSLISRLIRANIALYSAHTNADVQTTGASTILARAFGLTKFKPLQSSNGGFGHGCVGELAKPVKLSEFAKVVSGAIRKTTRGVAVAGNPDAIISRVAVCSGAGDSFIANAIEANADVYVTSDLRHHVTHDAVFELAVIDISHWAAEAVWVDGVIEEFKKKKGVEFLASEVSTDPWSRVY